jgi:hypothetical protein
VNGKTDKMLAGKVPRLPGDDEIMNIDFKDG